MDEVNGPKTNTLCMVLLVGELVGADASSGTLKLGRDEVMFIVSRAGTIVRSTPRLSNTTSGGYAQSMEIIRDAKMMERGEKVDGKEAAFPKI